MAVFTESLKQSFRFHAFYPIFSCRVDIGEDEDVGVVKSSEKIFEQGLRSRITMRLKYRNDSFLLTCSCRLERGHDLYGVMAIIIHDKNPLLLSFDLKPSLNPAKITQGFLDDLERNIQFKGRG